MNLFFILGNQLFPSKYLDRFKKDHLFFMAEDYELCTYEKHHKQKILLFLSSMRSHAESLKKDNESDKILHEKVRYEILRRFGYFVTESSEHFAEYTPWFIKRDRPDLINEYNIPLDEYISRCEKQISDWDEQKAILEDRSQTIEVCQSHEYAAAIINGLENGIEVTINGNVANDNLIDNLPGNICVEVPCIINTSGIQPVKVGRLPPHLAALMICLLYTSELPTKA